MPLAPTCPIKRDAYHACLDRLVCLDITTLEAAELLVHDELGASDTVTIFGPFAGATLDQAKRSVRSMLRECHRAAPAHQERRFHELLCTAFNTSALSLN